MSIWCFKTCKQSRRRGYPMNSTVRLASTIFNVGSSWPEIVFRSNSQWGGRVFSTFLHCLRFAQSILTIFHRGGSKPEVGFHAFQVWRKCFLDRLRPYEGGPVDFGLWTHGDLSGRLLPLCCRHTRKRLKSSNSRYSLKPGTALKRHFRLWATMLVKPLKTNGPTSTDLIVWRLRVYESGPVDLTAVFHPQQTGSSIPRRFLAFLTFSRWIATVRKWPSWFRPLAHGGKSELID